MSRVYLANRFHLSLPHKFLVSKFPGTSDGWAASMTMLPLLK